MDFGTPTLLYSEEEYGRTPKNHKSIFIYEWLRNLEDNVPVASKVSLYMIYFQFPFLRLKIFPFSVSLYFYHLGLDLFGGTVEYLAISKKINTSCT